MEDEWLKFKKYPHIGKPLTRIKDATWVKEYVLNRDNIAIHKFTPLLHRTLYQRKYRPLKDGGKTRTGKRIRSAKGRKERHIYFASHLDSIVYSYYSYLLNQAYEIYLADKIYAASPVAYRKIPIKVGKKGNRSNIEFAFETFSFLERNITRKLSIIVADVTSFFDNLDHRILHKQWKRVLNVEDMPNDHYTLYKSLSSKHYVNENELFKRFKNSLLVERFKPNDTSETVIKRKAVQKLQNLRQENVVAFCEEKEFFTKAVDLIRADKPYNSAQRKARGRNVLKGIPQGTPMSATLANIYMLDFDALVFEEVSGKNGFYQRYSDDLIIICDQENEQYFYDLIRREIEVKSKLEIQPEKTNIYRYSLDEKTNFAGGIVRDGVVRSSKQLEYLGFEYDGQKVRVKTAGFSKFYRNIKRSFRRAVHFAKKAHIPSDSMFEARLYKRFTHLGSKRRRRYFPDNSSPTGYRESKEYDWGNFISYLNKANSVMKAINGDDTIKNQYRKVWNKFHDIKKSSYNEIGKKQ